MLWRFFGVLLLLLTAPLLQAADVTLAITDTDLDLPHCQAFDGARSVKAASLETLKAVLGLQPMSGKLPDWTTGLVPGRDRAFRIAFTRPVTIGTILTTYTGGRSAQTLFTLGAGTSVSYLKAEAAAPGDVTDDAQWILLPPGEVKLLPPNTTTRALRFRDRRVQLPWANLEWGAEASTMGATLLLAGRYFTPVTLGTSKSLGRGAQWLGYWTSAQAVAALVSLHPRGAALRVECLNPDVLLHPSRAPKGSWSKGESFTGAFATPTLLRLTEARATQAVRVTAVGNGQVPPLIPLVDLGTAPEAPTLTLPPPPYKFTYGMPQDGFIAINITEKASGRHVRRLVAEVARLQGPITEPWDLKDDAGLYVPPGEYSWRAITRPPLRLTYEGTVNNAGTPPWYAPVKGGGGWMADHCPPVAVCGVGDLVFHSTYGAEYGQGCIATDLQGRKLWARHHGADRLATDGKSVYLISAGGVIRVDPHRGFAQQGLVNFGYSRDLPGPGTHYNNFEPDSGQVALHGKTLVVSYRAPGIPWVRPVFTGGDIDLGRCMPMPRSPGKEFDFRNYSEPQRLYGAFLTGDSPSAYGMSYYGDAPANGPLAGTLTVALHRPLPIGTIILPDSAGAVYALKAGARLPGAAGDPATEDPDAGDGADGGLDDGPFDEEQWIPFARTTKAGEPGIALAPAGGVRTQALRFKAGRIPYALVLDRRYQDLAPKAARIFGDGGAAPGGGWTATRPPTTPINGNNPACMALVWPAPVPVRGAVVIRPTPDGATAVDYWIGPADGDPAASLGDNSLWQQADVIVSRENFLNHPRTPAASAIDFGEVRTTRALRVRVTAPAGALGFGHPTITGPHKASFDRLLALSPLGDDPALPAPLNERLTVVQLPAAEEAKGTAKILRHIPLPRPNGLAFDAKGTLYVASAGRIVTLDPQAAEPAPREVIPAGQLQQPRAMLFDPEGLLYVVDAGPSVVKVFDVTTAKLIRTIGTPGGGQLGPVDPTRLYNPSGLGLDSAGKLWVTEEVFQPKRITRWSRDGKLEAQFFGPTTYGGGGHMDPGDKSVINYFGMKFRMDWATREWKFESRLYNPWMAPCFNAAAPDRVIYSNGKRYLVGDNSVSLFGDKTTVEVICQERAGIAVPIAAAGNLGAWSATSRPELRKAFGKLNQTRYGFCWSDLNGDGAPQPDEVQLSEKNAFKLISHVGEDLSFTFRDQEGARLRPTTIRPDGVPVYDLAKLEPMPHYTNTCLVAADGRAFVLGNHMVSADGKTVQWRYPDNYASVQASANAPGGFANRPPGVLTGELRIMGHFTLGQEEYFVTNGNHGDWYAFTRDGLLAGCIFGGPSGYGRRWWSMPECEPGKTDLTDLRLTVEDFYGSICKAEDGKVYAIAGKNHNSIVRVDGLEKATRLAGAFTVSSTDIQKTQAWALERATLERLRYEPTVASFPYVDRGPAIDGTLDDWPDELFRTVEEVQNEQGQITASWQVALAYDHEHLYLAGRATNDESPLSNSAADKQVLFQYGDALEVDLGLDPAADPARRVAVPGDLRLLVARVNGEPVVMLYRPVVPGTPPDKRITFTSPVGQETIDVIAQLKPQHLALTGVDRGWVAEAAIPWAMLGAKAPQIGTKLRADVGFLHSDKEGTATVRRVYWANKSQVILGDLPCESRITPALWGELECVEADDSLRFGGPESGDGPEL
jgi:sugar lactone lactonase YvrE